MASGLGVWWVYGNLTWVDSGVRRKKEVQEMPLSKYNYDELRERGGIAGEFELGGKIQAVIDRRDNCVGANCLPEADYSFETKQFKFKTDGRWMSGMINMPNSVLECAMNLKNDCSAKKVPAIVMVRGFAETAGYYSGSGSWRIADRLASKGYATVSLDFLGFADSDMPSEDILEARFEKVPELMDLLATVKSLNFVDSSKIGIWAHSNGGQITLSALETMGGYYPTVLWAPMTNPFPQSVLETIDDDEAGRIVRAKIEEFGQSYDFRQYAFENYYNWIDSPVLIHQGTADEWCELSWQQEVVSKLKGFGKTAELDVLIGDDHNLSKNWLEVVQKDVEFYNQRLGNF